MAAAAMVLMLMAGCKSKNSETAAGATDTSMSSMSGTDSSSMASSDTGRMASDGGGLSDANIVALLDEANMADSASGAYAVTKATSPDVKAFAKLMMGEHHMLRLEGQQLAKRLNVTPEPPASDPLKPAAQSEMAALQGAGKGGAFDRAYSEQEIGRHKAVLDVAPKGHDAAQSPQLNKLIEQA